MQIYLPASSPLLAYTPCKGCDVANGWQVGSQYDHSNPNGTDTGLVTQMQTGARLAFNFTGTGVAFDFRFSSTESTSQNAGQAPGAGSTSGWTTTMTVNGTTPPSGSVEGASLTDLPIGLHQIDLELKYNSGGIKSSNTPWARLAGVNATLGVLSKSSTNNTVIQQDDSAWRNGTIVLSAGWNMAETQGTDPKSNYLNEADFQNEITTVANNFNKSISWTTIIDATTTITFSGNIVTVYGITGGSAGHYEVRLDNQTVGVFDASGTDRVYQNILYHASQLPSGTHQLTLVNRDGRLSFDSLVARTGLLEPKNNPNSTFASGPFTTAGTTPDTTSSSSPKENRTGSVNGAVIGGAVGGIVGLLLLTLALFLLWTRWRRRPATPYSKSKLGWDENKPWCLRIFAKDKGWRFVNLPDGQPVMRELDAGSKIGSKSGYHKSSSSFGSAALALRESLPQPPRRSLLPIAAANLFRLNHNSNPQQPPLPMERDQGALSSSGINPLDVEIRQGGIPLQPTGRNSSNAGALAMAVGGHQSPLAQMGAQRSFSDRATGRGPVPAPIAVARTNSQPDVNPLSPELGVAEWALKYERERQRALHDKMAPHYERARDNSDALSPTRDGAAPPAADSGVKEWYDWFGLGTSGDNGGSKLSDSPSSEQTRAGSNPYKREEAHRLPEAAHLRDGSAR